MEANKPHTHHHITASNVNNPCGKTSSTSSTDLKIVQLMPHILNHQSTQFLPTCIECIGLQANCKAEKVCSHKCTNCNCNLERDAVDKNTQVRPKVHARSADNAADLTTVSRSLEGHYCILVKIMQAMRKLQYDSAQHHVYNTQGFQTVLSGLAQITREPNTVPSLTERQNKAVERASRSRLPSVINKYDDSVDKAKPERGGVCPKCGNVIEVLQCEITELRRTRDELLHVRNEANSILKNVMENAVLRFNERTSIEFDDFPEEARSETGDSYDFQHDLDDSDAPPKAPTQFQV